MKVFISLSNTPEEDYKAWGRVARRVLLSKNEETRDKWAAKMDGIVDYLDSTLNTIHNQNLLKKRKADIIRFKTIKTVLKRDPKQSDLSLLNKQSSGASKKSTMRQAVEKVWDKAKTGIAKKLNANVEGAKAIGKFITGGTLNSREKGRAKSFAKAAGILIVGAVLAVGMTTVLAPVAGQLGEEFMNWYQEQKQQSTSAENKEDTTTKFLTMMKDWILNQDPKELASKLKERSLA